VGALDRYVWKSKLPYELEFQSRTVRVERPHLMEGQAFGELEGTGRWRLWEGRDGVWLETYRVIWEGRMDRLDAHLKRNRRQK
jgi:hypothetical protein